MSVYSYCMRRQSYGTLKPVWKVYNNIFHRPMLWWLGEPSESVSTGLIVGVAVGVGCAIVIVILIIFLVFILVRYRRIRKWHGAPRKKRRVPVQKADSFVLHKINFSAFTNHQQPHNIWSTLIYVYTNLFCDLYNSFLEQCCVLLFSAEIYFALLSAVSDGPTLQFQELSNYHHCL